MSVNVGPVRTKSWNENLRPSAIDKRPVAGRVAVHLDRVGDDEHGDPTVHGGPDQAVYAYSREDAEYWQHELGRDLPPGIFGENLTTAGIAVSNAVAGERWQVGDVLLEVAAPRIPCRVFAGWWQIPNLVKRFTLAGRPGAYLRVVRTGAIGAGDAIEVVQRPGHGTTVSELLLARAGQRPVLPHMRTISTLPPQWRDWLSTVATG